MKIPARRPKNPLAVTRPPLLPPAAPSRGALKLATLAGQGRFALPVCTACGVVAYPIRDVCGACLGELAWRDVAEGGIVLARTVLRASGDVYFRQRLPVRAGLVRMDAGPRAVAFLQDDLQDEVDTGARVRLALRLDKAGQAVMLALPEGLAGEDALVHAHGCSLRDRRVLVTDARGPLGAAMAARALEAGAREVFAGEAATWMPGGAAPEGAKPVALDLTDERSVREFAAEFGGRVEIVINTALAARPGGVMDGDPSRLREAMELEVLGTARLARMLGPALRARGEDGDYGACAWVQAISADALAPSPGFGAHAAVQAASLSLALSLRAELRPIRVMTVFLGPLDDEWHQAVPPPKVAPRGFADAVAAGLEAGLEEIAVGDVARHRLERWREDPTLTIRETTHTR
jgi:NAD(P)-dependent dehydrogenase (short-subunit alcohol dehydrogenase family)/uncharacterized OB-fold protein